MSESAQWDPKVHRYRILEILGINISEATDNLGNQYGGEREKIGSESNNGIRKYQY